MSGSILTSPGLVSAALIQQRSLSKKQVFNKTLERLSNTLQSILSLESFSFQSFRLFNKQTFPTRLQRGCSQLCNQHNVEQHPTPLLEQLESGFDQSRLLPVHRPCLLWQVGNVTTGVQFCLQSSINFSNGVELAKALAEEGASVFGWDLEWNMNYNINRSVFSISDQKVVTMPSNMILMRETSGHCVDARYRYGGQPMFFRLNPRGGKLPGKQVIHFCPFSTQLATKSGRPHP